MGTCRNYLLLTTDMLFLLQLPVLKGRIVQLLRNMGEEYFLLPPRRQKFYRIFVSTMNIIGLANRTWWGFEPIHPLLSFHGKVLTTIAPLVSITQVMYLYVNYENLSFDVIGIVLCITPVSILVNINAMSTRLTSYKSVMADFMTKIHVCNYCTHHSDYTKKIMLIIERITRYTAYYLICFYGLNWFFWINIPIVHNISNKEQILNKTMQLQTCVYMWMPFDYGYSFKAWTVTHIINIYIVAMGVMIMATIHCINYMIIYHLIGHIYILKNTIQIGFGDDLGLSNEEVKNRLVGIIQHHSFILRIFSDVQSAFGINVAANYLHNLFSDSLILYQVLNGGDILSYTVMVVVYMGELILMSFVLEEIRKQSEDLPEVVYSIPWESMSVSNQKTLMLILSRVQTDMQFVALGGLNAGVQPMVSILKTTFSYYVMLKTSIESTEN